jgi:hypothetical protein
VILTLVALALAVLWWLLMSLDRYGRPFRQAGARVQGHLLEVLLYGAFPKVMLRALAAVTRACVSLSLSLLIPSLWFTLPLLVGVVITSASYAHRPVEVGEPVLVSLQYPHGDGHGPEWRLDPSPQFAIEVDDFRYPSKPVHLWRIRPLTEGRLTLVFSADGKRLDKDLQVGEGSPVLNPSRSPLGWNWLLSPLEPPIPSDMRSVEITVEYPDRTLAWKGWSAPWWLLLLLAFLGWSWLLTLVPAPGNRAYRRQPEQP